MTNGGLSGVGLELAVEKQKEELGGGKHVPCAVSRLVCSAMPGATPVCAICLPCCVCYPGRSAGRFPGLLLC